MTNRIRTAWHMLRQGGQKALIPYVTPEFPIPGVTADLVRTLEDAGASLVEIGIPFSDPLADGPVIQHASHRAIRNGARPERVLEIVSQIRTSSEIPVLLMGYVNPILRAGADRFFAEAASAGVDGLIIPDLPPEESSVLHQAARAEGLSMVYLVAPNTGRERIRKIDGLSTDFTYCVSMTGVTGASARFGGEAAFDDFLGRVKSSTTKPFVVGFGISTRADVERVWRSADGAVVGSQLLREIEDCATAKDIMNKARSFMTGLRPDRMARAE